MRQRTAIIKQSCVRIIVGGQAAGSGFVVSTDGLVVTNFHVVQNITSIAGGQYNVGFHPQIQVEFPGRGVRAATIHPACQGIGLSDAISRDYCLLETLQPGCNPLRLGTYAEIEEGDEVYLCGHPHGIDQQVVARGLLSTKWQTSGYLNQGPQRNVAWLDITQNSGNSGGPVVLRTDDPVNDVVIGIATFGLNPYAAQANKVAAAARSFPGGAVLMGIDFGQFAQLIGAALATNSIGVSGCVAIDYVKGLVAANTQP